MTDADAAPRLPEERLRDWPGRFRHAELMVHLHGSRSVDNLADSLLAGLAAGRDEDGALLELMESGEFDVAELVLVEAPAVSPRLRARLSEELESRRAARASQLISTVRNLVEQAAAAGIPFDDDTADLEAHARQSWPAVDEILTGRRRELLECIAERGEKLKSRTEDSPLGTRVRVAVKSLIEAGRLTVAERTLREAEPGLTIPEIQPPLLPWRWTESAGEVLSWHIDPSRACPPEFSAWRAVDEASQQLLYSTDGLGGGGQEAARIFAAALEAFLGGDREPPIVHAIEGGHLTTITLFRDAPLAQFHPTPSVDLV